MLEALGPNHRQLNPKGLLERWPFYEHVPDGGTSSFLPFDLGHFGLLRWP